MSPGYKYVGEFKGNVRTRTRPDGATEFIYTMLESYYYVEGDFLRERQRRTVHVRRAETLKDKNAIFWGGDLLEDQTVEGGLYREVAFSEGIADHVGFPGPVNLVRVK